MVKTASCPGEYERCAYSPGRDTEYELVPPGCRGRQPLRCESVVCARVAASKPGFRNGGQKPSTRVPARVAAAKTRKVRGSCTDYYVHLNLLECITCSAMRSLTVTFSISGREVAPKAVRSCMETGDHSVFAPRSFLMILSISGMDRFYEALKSAFARKPHFVQQNTACDGLLLLSMFPHLLHRWEV